MRLPRLSQAASAQEPLAIGRRQLLKMGTAATVACAWPAWPLGNHAFRQLSAAESTSPLRPTASAKSCLQLFLWGGPGQHETWDLKPHAPDGIRGPFAPIATRVPGTFICEHLPLLALRADLYTLVRSLSHTGVNHGTSAYHMLTGHLHWSPGTLRHPTPKDMPNLGCNASRFLPHASNLPAHVHLPGIINDGDGLPVPGQDPGILGDTARPFRVLADLTQPDFRVAELMLQAGLSRSRLISRTSLRQTVSERDALFAEESLAGSLDESYDRALALLSSDSTQAAFDLSKEPAAVRERYGWHHCAQALVLARRLIEAGVPYVTVYWNSPSNTDDQSWDTHVEQDRRMKDHLLPAFDRGLSALLDDLRDRGLLDQTLVTWYGEFGRTPKVNSAGGRDHWGFCQSIGLAGGGIQGGLLYGASTPDGGYPSKDAVSPDDLSATVMHCLGIDHTQEMLDNQGRPAPLSRGNPVLAWLK